MMFYNTFLKEQFETINERKIIYNIFIMNENYIYIYNNLINFTRNKDYIQIFKYEKIIFQID